MKNGQLLKSSRKKIGFSQQDQCIVFPILSNGRKFKCLDVFNRGRRLIFTKNSKTCHTNHALRKKTALNPFSINNLGVTTFRG